MHHDRQEGPCLRGVAHAGQLTPPCSVSRDARDKQGARYLSHGWAEQPGQWVKQWLHCSP